jgi:hypothetical protein
MEMPMPMSIMVASGSKYFKIYSVNLRRLVTFVLHHALVAHFNTTLVILQSLILEF